MNAADPAISGQTLLARAEALGFFDSLYALYVEMDRAYDAAAAAYGFTCSGCEDNCCLTRFYHHTYVEYLYLLAGFNGLPRDRRTQIRRRAGQYVRAMEAAEAAGETLRHMCPVNDAGMCLLYGYRPMICRLHGVPHELNPPGRGRVYGAGCARFEQQYGNLPYHRFDRTPFYMKMADLESRFKAEAGLSEKIKRTVAQMLLSK